MPIPIRLNCCRLAGKRTKRGAGQLTPKSVIDFAAHCCFVIDSTADGGGKSMKRYCENSRAHVYVYVCMGVCVCVRATKEMGTRKHGN